MRRRYIANASLSLFNIHRIFRRKKPPLDLHLKSPIQKVIMYLAAAMPFYSFPLSIGPPVAAVTSQAMDQRIDQETLGKLLFSYQFITFLCFVTCILIRLAIGNFRTGVNRIQGQWCFGKEMKGKGEVYRYTPQTSQSTGARPRGRAPK